MIGLRTPIDSSPELAAFPPIHKHEEVISHPSDTKSDQIKEIILENNPRQPSILPTLLNKEKAAELPTEKHKLKEGLEVDSVTTVSVNSQPVDFNNSEVNFNESKGVANNFPAFTPGLDVKHENVTSKHVDYKYKEDMESPLNDFLEPLSSKEVRIPFDPNIPFHETEPESGIHGVKLINGHLHFQNT